MKRLIQLVESNARSSKFSYIDICMQCIDMLNGLTHKFNTDTSLSPKEKRFYAGGQISRWWNLHFSEIKSYAHGLKTNRDSYMYRVAMIPVSALKSDNPSNTMSKSDGMKFFLSFAPESLKEINEGALASKFRKAYERFQEAKDRDDTPLSSVNQQQAAQRQQRQVDMSSQYKAVEEIVNQHIALLPVSLRSKARDAVARSANKLKALQQFLKDQE